MHSRLRTISRRIALYAFLLLVIILGICLPACAPTVQWSRTFSVLAGRAVQQTADGGYIMCGNNVLMKTDSAGNKVWDKTLSTDNVYFSVIQQTTDGGYVVCGTSYERRVFNPDEVADVWLIKTDASGNETWEKTFPGAASGSNCSAKQTIDGGYVLCGIPWFEERFKSGIWLIKTDASGDKLWDKIFGGKFSTIQEPSVQQTEDNGYIVCGTTLNSESHSVIWLIKTDVDGNKMWDKMFSGAFSDSGSSAQQTSDGGYIVCGTHEYSEPDIWLIKTDADGNKIWDKTFAGNMSISAQPTKDGGYIVYGQNYCGMESLCLYRVSLIKTDANGNQLWKKRFAGKGEAHAGAVQQTMDGGYVICAYTGGLLGITDSALLIKIAPERR